MSSWGRPKVPAGAGGAARLGGGGAGGAGGAPFGGAGGGAASLGAGGAGGAPLVGGLGVQLAPSPLYLPYRYRTATALHTALALAPPNTVGELWGPSALIFRAVLAAQGATQRLLPLGWVNLSATSSTGAEWDYSGVLGSPDYRWLPVDGAFAPVWSEAPGGLTIATAPGGAIYNPGLARMTLRRASLYALTAATSFSGLPAVTIPRVYAGFWRVAGGVNGGLTAAAAQNVAAGTGTSWQRAQLQTDPDAPTNLGSPTGAITAPTAEVIPVAHSIIGVDQVTARALFGGGWIPALDAAGTAPAANASMGSAGDGLAPLLGAIGGDATAPPKLTWTGFEYSGQLAAA